MPLEVPIAREIWEAKYRFCAPDGSGDADFSATAARVAQAVAANEKPAQRKVWEQRFAEAIETLTFIPAGRILAGAGTGRRVTLFNCFVMGVIEDSIPGIFRALKQGAVTMRLRMSWIRPNISSSFENASASMP